MSRWRLPPGWRYGEKKAHAAYNEVCNCKQTLHFKQLNVSFTSIIWTLNWAKSKWTKTKGKRKICIFGQTLSLIQHITISAPCAHSQASWCLGVGGSNLPFALFTHLWGFSLELRNNRTRFKCFHVQRDAQLGIPSTGVTANITQVDGSPIHPSLPSQTKGRSLQQLSCP